MILRDGKATLYASSTGVAVVISSKRLIYHQEPFS
jgi:hypothetical protein